MILMPPNPFNECHRKKFLKDNEKGCRQVTTKYTQLGSCPVNLQPENAKHNVAVGQRRKIAKKNVNCHIT